MKEELRSHQVAALDMLREAVREGSRRTMLQAPTGMGKTKLAAAVVDGALKKGKRVVFTVPAISLVDQTLEMFWAEGIRDIGVIQADHAMTNWSQPVQVASVQTLMRRKLPEADVVITDEAHRWFDFYGAWMADEAWKHVPFIGLSATPWTKGLGKYYDKLIIATTTEQLIKEGYLSPFRVFAPSHPDLTGVKVVAGDYHEGQLSEAMQRGKLTADIVETWLKRGENRSTFCFAVDCAHAHALHEKFEAAGVKAAYLDAFTDLRERAVVKRKFHDGEVRVVCNVGVLTMGIDWDVRCIVLARPTRSEILFVQIIGRGLRTAEGKEDCLILDHSDSTLRLGFVTDINHDHLDDGKERQKAKPRAALPRECPKCAALRPPRVSVCPVCGFKAAAVVSGVSTRDGELVEVNGKRVHTMREKLAFFSELKAYCQQRGYKPGWASNQYREKFGVWPDWSIKNVPAAIYPSAKTVQWITSRHIAWARSKRNPANA